MTPPWPRDPNLLIRSILARPEFHAAVARDAAPSPLERLVRWLRDLLGPVVKRLLSGVSTNPAAGALVLDVLYAVAGLAAIFLVVALARYIVSVIARRARTPSGAGSDGTDPTAPDALRRAAAAAAAAGEFARAIALLFRAALFVLDRAALLGFDAARTPGEYRRLVRRDAAGAAAAFDVLTTRFVFATFGTSATNRADYEAAERAYVAFLPLAVMP